MLLKVLSSARVKNALHYAAETGSYEIFKHLIDHLHDSEDDFEDWSINCLDEDEKAPLFYAAELGNLELINVVFLENDASTAINICGNGDDFRRVTALCHAVDSQKFDACRLLLEHGPKNLANMEYPNLCTACELGNIDIVCLLLDYNADVNGGDFDGYFPLISACSIGNYEIAELLIDRGANVNYVEEGENGTTPLHAASEGKYTALLQLLVEYGAKLTIKDGMERYAYEVGSLPFYAEKGMKLCSLQACHLRDNDEETVLNWLELGLGISFGKGLHDMEGKAKMSHAIFHHLLAFGLDMDSEEIFEDMLEFCLGPAFNEEKMFALLSRGTFGDSFQDICKRFEVMEHFCVVAAERHREMLGKDDAAVQTAESLMRFMVTNSMFDINSTQFCGSGVLGEVAQHQNVAHTIRLLLELGAEIDSVCEPTPLMQACRINAGASVAILLQAGAKATAQDSGKLTPLHYCFISVHDHENSGWLDMFNFHTKEKAKLHYDEEVISVIEMLLAAGANPRAEDKDGQTPISMAKKLNFVQSQALMEKCVR